MDLPVNINIDPEAIERQVVDAIVNSALGGYVKKGIEDALKTDWRGTSPLQTAITAEVQQQSRIMMREMIREGEVGERLRKMMLDALTPEVLEGIVAKFVHDLGLIRSEDINAGQ